MVNWIKSKDLCLYIITALTIKNIVISPSISDAIVFIAATAIYAFNMHLKSKQADPANEQLKQEIAELKSSITALSIRPAVSKPSATTRMF